MVIIIFARAQILHSQQRGGQAASSSYLLLLIIIIITYFIVMLYGAASYLPSLLFCICTLLNSLTRLVDETTDCKQFLDNKYITYKLFF